MEQIAIQMNGITKEYRLGTIGGRTLQADLQSWWARRRGKEDPNSKIGQNERLVGQRFLALNGIDLTICQGESVGIIGANGAGKSTLLKLLSRVTAPTSGEIDLYGRVSSMLEVGTGFHREMTGRENIYMNGAILGMTKAQIDERIEEIIDFSEVREFIDTPVKRYSSGMFVKLAFAVAAHLDSEIMIMDEVLAVGDMAFQTKCLARMRQAAEEEGRTVLYVSHNMNTIRRLCQRCIVLDKGRILFDGDVEEAISIYMNRSLQENCVDIDLRDKGEAVHRGVNGKILEDVLQMEHLTLIDKITPVYEADEPYMKLRLRICVGQPVSDVAFRLTLRNDADTGIGTAWYHGLNFPKTGTQELEISFPLKQLAKGEFYASIGFYREPGDGSYRKLSHITRAFKFQVLGAPKWKNSVFGYVEFGEMQVKTIVP